MLAYNLADIPPRLRIILLSASDFRCVRDVQTIQADSYRIAMYELGA
jgi:hypothetical protein